ncbi:hypothetical protein Z949_1860 [Sulfitobacter guttiformis KCTC 32187]|nr:hypothetical protein Z949_1860 [Sulfitobacter guttiformis KCTC 32187]
MQVIYREPACLTVAESIPKGAGLINAVGYGVQIVVNAVNRRITDEIRSPEEIYKIAHLTPSKICFG